MRCESKTFTLGYFPGIFSISIPKHRNIFKSLLTRDPEISSALVVADHAMPQNNTNELDRPQPTHEGAKTRERDPMKLTTTTSDIEWIAIKN
jgi:hypothetical protein